MPNDKEKAPAKSRAGFDDKGKAYPGVDPDTGERVTVTLDALKSEFGAKRGADMYRRVAEVAGGGAALLPESVEQYPRDIGLTGADKSIIERVNAILTEKE